MSREAGKILLILGLTALMAAGCGNSTVTGQGDTNQNTNNQPVITPTPSPTAMDNSGMQMDSSTWQGTLMTSNNSAKGKYMLTVSGHTVYINTGRDYSALVGKEVNVSYKGTMNSFSLSDITAK